MLYVLDLYNIRTRAMDDLKEARNEVMHKAVRFSKDDLTQEEWWEFTVIARKRRKRIGQLLGLYIRSINHTFGGNDIGNANQDPGPGEGV